MGDVVEGAGEAVRLLPRRVRARIEILAVTAFLGLLVVGKADDVVLWLWRELSATQSSMLERAFSSFTP